MTDLTTWIVEDRVLLAHYTGDVTLEDLIQVQTRIEDFLQAKTSPYATHIIIDMQAVTDYPHNVQDLLKSITLFRSEGLGWNLLITNDTVLRFLGSALVQISQGRFHHTTTITETLQFLHDADETLPSITEADYRNAIRRIESSKRT